MKTMTPHDIIQLIYMLFTQSLYYTYLFYTTDNQRAGYNAHERSVRELYKVR